MTNCNDEMLKTALASLDDVMGDGDDCPVAERIWKSAAGELGRSDDRVVVSHLQSCGSCSKAWRIARELVRDVTPVETPVSTTWSSRRRWVPIAVAASIVIAVVGIGVLRYREPENRRPIYREQRKEWLESATPTAQALPRDSCTLRWTAGPEGTAYDLLVMDGDLQPLDRSRWLDRPEFTLNTGDLESVSPGGRILWRVTAHLPDGRRVVSRTFTTRVE